MSRYKSVANPFSSPSGTWIAPPRSQRAGVPAFAAGWFFSETAPQMLALTALDAAAHLTKGRRSGLRAKAGLALAGANVLGLAHLVRQSRRAVGVLDDALVEGLGVDYVEQLDAAPDPADLATPWRSLARPFDFRDDAVRVIRNLPYSEAGRRGHLDIYLPAGDDAIKDAIAAASKTIHNIRWFQVVETRGHVEDGKVAHFQVTLKIGFTLDDR